MSAKRRPDTIQKAFEINLDKGFYGSFAEIGAGQEVARYFFRAGGAAGTIAKSMSAYDMTVSDEIYGKSKRFVSKERVETMLTKEFNQLQGRLEKERGAECSFFAFANTVAAKSFKNKSECHGWLGMNFQHHPKSEINSVILHIRMLDKDNLQQQEALGIMGTNMVYGCYKYSNNRDSFIDSLMDNISRERVVIDFIDIKGPAFIREDPRLWSLELVKRGFSETVMFDSNGAKIRPKDALYKKNILVCRGSYRPPTLFNLEMLKKGMAEFKKAWPKEKSDQFVTLPEISMHKLLERGEVNPEDFLARVELLGSLGHMVLISSFETYGDLSFYLSNCTKKIWPLPWAITIWRKFSIAKSISTWWAAFSVASAPWSAREPKFLSIPPLLNKEATKVKF